MIPFLLALVLVQDPVEDLLRRLSDADPAVRDQAQRALTGIRDQIEPVLRERLAAESDPEVAARLRAVLLPLDHRDVVSRCVRAVERGDPFPWGDVAAFGTTPDESRRQAVDRLSRQVGVAIRWDETDEEIARIAEQPSTRAPFDWCVENAGDLATVLGLLVADTLEVAIVPDGGGILLLRWTEDLFLAELATETAGEGRPACLLDALRSAGDGDAPTRWTQPVPFCEWLCRGAADHAAPETTRAGALEGIAARSGRDGDAYLPALRAILDDDAAPASLRRKTVLLALGSDSDDAADLVLDVLEGDAADLSADVLASLAARLGDGRPLRCGLGADPRACWRALQRYADRLQAALDAHARSGDPETSLAARILLEEMAAEPDESLDRVERATLSEHSQWTLALRARRRERVELLARMAREGADAARAEAARGWVAAMQEWGDARQALAGLLLDDSAAVRLAALEGWSQRGGRTRDPEREKTAVVLREALGREADGEVHVSIESFLR